MTLIMQQHVAGSSRPNRAVCELPRPRQRRRDQLCRGEHQKSDKFPVTFIDLGANKTYFLSRWGAFAPMCRAQDVMTLSELAERLDIPPRQIRFMIAEGILPPASRTGRSADGYDEAHVEKGLRYLALHRLGMKPGSIKVLMAFDDAVPILQTNGVELRVDPMVSPADLDVDAILAAARAALEAYKGKD